MGLLEHLSSGATTVARAWSVTRRDGERYGFTDHDQDVHFDDLTFRADTGLSALALQQATGLSVDNTEAIGALSDSALSEADILAGRFDGAEVIAWMLNWADTAERKILFRGHLGEIARAGGAFRAELRGLSEGLNRPVGRVFQAPCSAVLGDGSCRFDTATPGYVWTGALLDVIENRELVLPELDAFAPGWFQRGLVRFETGAAQGLTATVKRDVWKGARRHLELWHRMPAQLSPDDVVQVVAGCDKRFETCRLKFNNAVIFLGFPDIPQDDWVVLHASMASTRSGGSRR